MLNGSSTGLHPRPVGVLCKAVFLSSTLQIAIGHMVQFRVTLPERSYPPAAERTDTPLYKVEGITQFTEAERTRSLRLPLKKKNSSKLTL